MQREADLKDVAQILQKIWVLEEPLKLLWTSNRRTLSPSMADTDECLVNFPICNTV